MAGSSSGDTAGTLVLVGLVLQIVEVVVLFALGLVFLIVPILGGLALALAVVGIVWVLLVYALSYQRIRVGDYRGAETPTLVFAILALLTGSLVSGILYIVAYAKLGDAQRETRGAQLPWGAPAAPYASYAARPGERPCSLCGQLAPSGAAFCAGCGSRLR